MSPRRDRTRTAGPVRAVFESGGCIARVAARLGICGLRHGKGFVDPAAATGGSGAKPALVRPGNFA